MHSSGKRERLPAAQQENALHEGCTKQLRICEPSAQHGLLPNSQRFSKPANVSLRSAEKKAAKSRFATEMS
jgi:hypothetical protein